ncbi:MAG TPA: M1 family aminopeptidase [Candidatus Limnocylindria bacterium]|nr:M1 family aminopeptidase [Candidatus Limnocylindria bacterium]
MRPRRRFAPVALAVGLTLGAMLTAPPPASAIPEEHVGQKYAITATLDVAARRLDADVELTLVNRGASPMDHVDLTLVPRSLGWLVSDDLDVTVDGASVSEEWTTAINLRVPLDGLRVHETTTIRIPFALVVGRAPDAFSARTSAENGVLSFGQWFPIVSTEHDVYGLGDPQISFTAASVRLELRTTTSLPRNAVACPGLASAPPGTGTAWTCEAGQVRDFSFVVNPRFRLVERAVGDVDVRVYAETVDGNRTADLATQALIGLEETFGPYPWDDLVLAEVGAGGGFSMEYPRMIHLTRGKVTDPYVVYHEVAHQWFYGQVGNDQQAEPWLDEALADFSARYLMGVGENQCSTRPVDSEVFAWPAAATTGGDWTSCDGYFHAVFYRGTEFLTAVRSTMGDGAFFRAMRAWVDRNRHGFATGDELLRHLERHTDADLRPIFDAYLGNTDAAVRHRPASAGARPQ